MSEAIALALPTDERRPRTRAVAWLCLLGPFFFLSYGTANWLAAQRAEVGSVVFDWEHAIPFLAWTIIPYWSIDAFYGLSLFVCANKAELDTSARRLLTAQIVAVTCFILLPLRFTFERPQATGVAGALFDVLTSFDKPFNQAPPLHIALLVILWPLYARHVPRWALCLLHPWFALLFVSVLTTYQHHFIDLPTGALLGFFCLWLWPDGAASPVAGARLTRDPKRGRLAASYSAGGVLLAAPALGGGVALWLLWPAISLAFVAANYAAFDVWGFQKGANRRMSMATSWLLAPYVVGAWANSRLWTRVQSKSVSIRDGVWLGRTPWPRAANHFAQIVDLWPSFPAFREAAPSPCSTLSSRRRSNWPEQQPRSSRRGVPAACWCAARSAIRAVLPRLPPGCSRPDARLMSTQRSPRSAMPVRASSSIRAHVPPSPMRLGGMREHPGSRLSSCSAFPVTGGS